MNAAMMLTLVAITYRGCEYNLSNAHSRYLVYTEVARCLDTFPETHGKWRIEWGPAGYQPPTGGPDISEMYVVRDADDSSNLAIVIRGTNLFSAIDWMSNFPLLPKHWEYGNAGSDVKISESTRFGLRLLQHLQSGEVPAQDAAQSDIEKVAAARTAKESAAVYALMKKVFAGVTKSDGTDLIEKTRARAIADAQDIVAAGKDSRLAQAQAEAEKPSPTSRTLLEYLKFAMASGMPPKNIYIVGHSKSGALAPALALWLADTQGRSVEPPAQWDPDRKARLHVYTFAGPTPGNAAFTARFQSAPTIVERYRSANPFDIVPHVWNPTEIKEISGLYRDQLMFLKVPADVVAASVKIFGYEHEGAAQQGDWPDVMQPNFLERAAVEHLDGYLKQFKIYDERNMNTLALFAPVAR